jgi:hypothetical protein
MLFILLFILLFVCSGIGIFNKIMRKLIFYGSDRGNFYQGMKLLGNLLMFHFY